MGAGGQGFNTSDVRIEISSSEEMRGDLSEFAKNARESYGSDVVFMFSGPHSSAGLDQIGRLD